MIGCIGCLAAFLVARIQPVHLLVHHVNCRIDCLRRHALQIGIERCVDVQPFAVEVAIAKLLHQFVAHQVHKVRRLAGIHAARRQMQRLLLGGLRLLLGNRAGLHHRVQHQVAPIDRAVGMPEGAQPIRALDDACQQRALRQVELAHILAKVGLRSLAEAINRKAAALAKVDLVGIHLKNLFLAEAMFELKGDHNLDQLALDAPLRREKESPRQLHRQRRAALNKAMSRRQIVAQRAQYADVVHAAVIEESPVFNCHHRMHKVRRNLVVGHKTALGAVGISLRPVISSGSSS